jgi:hypothetical protein
MPQTPLPLALLIDGDNASPASIPSILTAIAKYGIPIAKRVYADWRLPAMSGWASVMETHGLKAVQQDAYTSGKNAIDIAMVIDAMDLLATGRVKGFCLVSSDSDFTPLAVRLRKQGIRVYGFGRGNTPESFQKACDTFTLTPTKNKAKPIAIPLKPPAQKLRPMKEAEALLIATMRRLSPENEWQELGRLGHDLSKDTPGFKPGTYGFATLTKLIRASQKIELLSADKACPHGKARLKKSA